MGDRKHGEKSNETKAVQPKRDEEQQPDKKPSEALSRFSANIAQPEDIQTLQRSVGNRAVQRLIQTSGDVVQRSFRDDPEYREWRDRMIPILRPMSASLEEVRTHHGSEGASIANTVASNNAAHDIWNEATATAEGTATEESEASTERGGGESQSPQSVEDIYEGGGRSPERQNINL